jgi:hypothetical protein
LGTNSFNLKYEISGAIYEINYTADLKTVNMTFLSPDGAQRTESYVRK